MIRVRKLPGRPVIAAGVAVTALLTGAGVAMAATSGSAAPGSRSSPLAAARSGLAAASPSPSPTPLPRRVRFGGPPPFAFGFGPGFAGGPFGFAGGPFGAIHGQFVVPKPGGGYQTVDTQRGSVTAVSATSITVKSSDGFTKTYRVTSSTIVAARRDGIASVKTGHQVTVMATVSGSTATAVGIVDLSALPRIQVAMPPVRLKGGWKVPAPVFPPGWAN